MRISPSLFIALAFFYSSIIHAQVVINEVHVKPAPSATGSDIQSLKVCAQPTYGTEFIELYNADPCIPADISCFILASSAFSSATNGSFRFPAGTTIPPQGHISIGGPNSGATFNLTSFCGDPHLLTGNDRWYLANGDMYLALYDDQGNPVNAVFWTSNAGEAAKWGTDSDLDEAPQYIPNGVNCPSVTTLPMPNGVVDYAGGSPALGKSLSRSEDGAATWAELSPSINDCNDGICVPSSSFGVKATVQQPTCGTINGSISLSPDVPGSYTYTWSPNVSSSASANNLGESNYYIQVSDGFCSWDTTISLTVPVPFGVSADVNQPLCNGGKGDITLSPDGAGPYTYSWTPNVSSSGTANNLSSGSYQVNIDDGYCQWDSTIIISDPPEISFNTGSEPAPCSSIQKGLAYVYNLSGGTGTLNISWSSPSSNNDTIYNLASGNYAFEITDENGCKKNGAVNVGEGPGPNVTTNQNEYNACFGEAVEVIANGANTYEINPNEEFSSTTYPNQFVSEENTQGTFWMIGMDADGCKDSVQFTLVRFDAPQGITLNHQQTSCSEATGEIEVIHVFGGTPNYQYNLNAGAFGNVNAFTGLDAGSYSIGVIDANGCRFDSLTQVTTASGPTAIFTSTTNSNCTNEDGILVIDSVHGGTAPYEYAVNSGTFSGNTTYTSLDSGIYTVIVKDLNGCTFEIQSSVGINPGISDFSLRIEPELCGRGNGEIYVEEIIGGTTPYTFSIDDVNFKPDSGFQNLSQDFYNLTVKDAIGCIKDSLIQVTELTSPVLNIISQNNPKCYNDSSGTILSEVIGGSGTIKFTWYNQDQIAISSSNQLLEVPYGDYKIVVKDTNQCADSTIVSLINPSKIAISVTTSPTGCTVNNGSATASVTGGTGNYTYNWNTIPVQNGATATGLGSSRPYTLIVADENQCERDTTININTLSGPQIEFVSENQISCADSSDGRIITTIVGGTKPFNFSWNTSPVQNDTVAKNLGQGTYSLTVTDKSGCSATYTHTLNAPPVITATLNSIPDACFQGNGSIEADAFGGTGTLQYLWDDPNAQTSETAINLVANSYSVLISDANGCQKTFSTTVNSVSGPIIDNVSLQNVNCEGGSDGQIAVSATGNTALSYTWQKMPLPSTIISVNPNVSGLDTGRYLVEIKDENGCLTDSIIMVGFNYPKPVFSLPSDTAFCEGDSVLIDNNELADSFLWMPTGETTQRIYAKQGGEYRLKLNRNGCTYEDTIHIREDVMPELELGEDSIFCGAVMITLDITVNGDATYEWKGGSNNPIQTFTLPDEYWATIVRNRCINSDTVEFFSQPELEVVLPKDTVLCDGENLLISPELSNSVDPNYNWSTGQSSSEISISESDKIWLKVEDGKCVATDTMEIVFIEQPLVDLGNDTTMCEGDSLWLVSKYPSYTNVWQDGTSNDSLLVKQAGNYSLNVNNQRCTHFDNIIIQTQPIPQFSLGKDTAICYGESLIIGATSSNLSATYLWNTGANSSYIEVFNEANYILEITEGYCSNTDSLEVLVNPLPNLYLKDLYKCPLDTQEIKVACQGCELFVWENGDTANTQTLVEEELKSVKVISRFGCVNHFNFRVVHNTNDACFPQLFVPNSFTPDNDGVNEGFRAYFEYPDLLSDFYFSVYNRWGELIFESSDIFQYWNGDFNLNPCQEGIYIWKVSYSLVDEAKIREKFGKVNLMR